ncbi:hypothetical protein L596_017073 [Steinernema carpocapsae]|nr:hypothetical protein L596_017073 [Steinernema carpocapsae]
MDDNLKDFHKTPPSLRDICFKGIIRNFALKFYGTNTQIEDVDLFPMPLTVQQQLRQIIKDSLDYRQKFSVLIPKTMGLAFYIHEGKFCEKRTTMRLHHLKLISDDKYLAMCLGTGLESELIRVHAELINSGEWEAAKLRWGEVERQTHTVVAAIRWFRVYDAWPILYPFLLVLEAGVKNFMKRKWWSGVDLIIRVIQGRKECLDTEGLAEVLNRLYDKAEEEGDECKREFRRAAAGLMLDYILPYRALKEVEDEKFVVRGGQAGEAS